MVLVRDTVHQHIIVNVMNVVVGFHVILHNVQLVIHIQSARVATTVDTTIVYVQIVDIVVLADADVVLEVILAVTLAEGLVEVQRYVLLVAVAERKDIVVADTQV